jgi:hypothetical protein
MGQSHHDRRYPSPTPRSCGKRLGVFLLLFFCFQFFFVSSFFLFIFADAQIVIYCSNFFSLFFQAAIINGSMFVLGGQGANERIYDDFYALDLHSKVWSKIDHDTTLGVPPRMNQVCSAFDECIVLFGGFENGKYTNDTYMYDTREQVGDAFHFPSCSVVANWNRHFVSLWFVCSGLGC